MGEQAPFRCGGFGRRNIVRQASNGNRFADAGAGLSAASSLARLILPTWDTTFAQSGQEDAMLSNYDAKAVAEVLGLVLLRASRPSAVSAVLVEKAIEGGLPRNALRRVAELIAGGDKAKASALERTIVPKTTLERRENKLSPQEGERTERIARLFVHARRALGTEAEAREFMTAPHPELERRSPIEAAKTDLGARRAEQILNALEYGLAI